MTTEEHIDPEERIKLLQEQLALKELLAQASVEAIQYALFLGEDDSDSMFSFLDKWNEGDWVYLDNYYPEFDIKSEAQQALINASGGMPS